MNDEREKIDDVFDEEPEEQPKPEAAAEGDLVAPKIKDKEAWKGGSGCSSRLPLYGCVIGLVVLIGFLMAGTSMMRRTVWLNFERSRSAVLDSIPRGISPAEVNRTRTNLNRFRTLLEKSDDPYPQMGEFVTRVRELLADGRISEAELEVLNLTLEKWIEESGIPELQLDAKMRNSEFGIRNSVFPPNPRRHAVGWVEDSQLETRRSNSRPA